MGRPTTTGFPQPKITGNWKKMDRTWRKTLEVDNRQIYPQPMFKVLKAQIMKPDSITVEGIIDITATTS